MSDREGGAGVGFEITEWVRVRAVEGSEASQRYAGQLGRVIGKTTVPGWDYTLLMEDGTEQLIPEEALTRVPVDADGEPLL